MNQQQSLAGYFAGWARGRSARLAVAGVVGALADASLAIADVLSQGALAGQLGRSTGKRGDVDDQKDIDVLANDRIVTALRSAPVAAVASEEMEDPLLLDSKAPLLVAIDPLDGSSNADANASIGTIFTVLPALEHNEEPSAFLQPGCRHAPDRKHPTRRRPAARRQRRRRHTDLYARPESAEVRAHACEGRDPAAHQRVRYQRLERAPLGRSHPDLRR